MPAPSRPPVDRPISLTERAQRLREKMIATALLDLEDWSPPRAVYPIDDAGSQTGSQTEDETEDETEATPSFQPPPVRWPTNDSAA